LHDRDSIPEVIHENVVAVGQFAVLTIFVLLSICIYQQDVRNQQKKCASKGG
jgi:hypothetical protein